MRCAASRIGFVIDRTWIGIPGKLGSGATTRLIQPYSTSTRSSGRIAAGVAVTMVSVVQLPGPVRWCQDQVPWTSLATGIRVTLRSIRTGP